MIDDNNFRKIVLDMMYHPEAYSKEDYYEAFNYFFKKMKDIGLTLQDINDNLEKLKLSPKMEELFDYLRINKSKYEIIIFAKTPRNVGQKTLHDTITLRDVGQKTLHDTNVFRNVGQKTLSALLIFSRAFLEE